MACRTLQLLVLDDPQIQDLTRTIRSPHDRAFSSFSLSRRRLLITTCAAATAALAMLDLPRTRIAGGLGMAETHLPYRFAGQHLDPEQQRVTSFRATYGAT